jgi:hypothetical protein
VRTPFLLVILVFILTIWNPASLALHAASVVSAFSTRSTLVLVFLGIRIATTSIGIAAGMALWLRRPGALRLAKTALVLFAVQTAVRFSLGIDVGGAPPGTRLPLAILIISHNAAWLLYLHLSRRVHAAYSLESRSGGARR